MVFRNLRSHFSRDSGGRGEEQDDGPLRPGIHESWSKPDVSDLRSLADELASTGRYLDAIDALTRANRVERSPANDRRLARLRHDAFLEIEDLPGLEEWPPQLTDAFPECDGLVEVRADELTPELMGAAIVHHGCLLVRGLFPHATADALVADIDRAFEAQETWLQDMEGKTGKQALPGSPWFEPFRCDLRYPVVNIDFGRMKRDYNRVLMADSPPTMFNFVEALDAAGVRRLVTGYLGQRPVLTVNKWALRRMPYKRRVLDWHQEASVFNSRTRTVNFWIALSDCGDDAAGIEVLPYRVDHIIAPPENEYWLSKATVDRLDIGEPVAPIFAPGDALVFDDHLLHRTKMSGRVTKARYSTETWFFAPSHTPLDQGPIVF